MDTRLTLPSRRMKILFIALKPDTSPGFTNDVIRLKTDDKNKSYTSSIALVLAESAASSGNFTGSVTVMDQKGKTTGYDVAMDASNGLTVNNQSDSITAIGLGGADLCDLFNGKEITIQLTNNKVFKGKYKAKHWKGALYNKAGNLIARYVKVNKHFMSLNSDTIELFQ